MLFYDFEVFKEDWLVVIIDMNKKKEHVIINDSNKLEEIYNENVNDIWVGFNSRHYDQYILKGILCGFDPKRINDYIIVKGNPGWKFSSLFRNIPLNNYDIMSNIDRGLKSFEGFMGNDIKESSVPFDINRKLTDKEIQETVKYCRHDVEQTIEVFLQRKEDFEACMGLVKLACQGKPLNLSLISKTKSQLAAIILEATPKEYDDEFNIDFPSTLKIEKYQEVVNWYKNKENMCYEKDGKKNQLDIMIAGVPHQFGWGGVHGAIPQYSGEGYFLNMDVASLYPSLMIQYNLHSRSMKDPKKYEEIYHTRLKYKKEKNPLQAPLKLVLNSTYGVMKDKNNGLYDREQRTHLKLEFDEYRKVFQKDVNNYIIVDANGKYKSKGAYVKKLNNLDYDLPIINKALVDYMVHDVPVEKTINECNDLKEFQLVTKISNKYMHILHGDEYIKEKCIRIFASKDENDKGVTKIHATTGRPAKIPNSPEHCFIFNDEVNGVKVPTKLDKAWYVDLAQKRLNDFGVI